MKSRRGANHCEKAVFKTTRRTTVSQCFIDITAASYPVGPTESFSFTIYDALWFSNSTDLSSSSSTNDLRMTFLSLPTRTISSSCSSGTPAIRITPIFGSSVIFRGSIPFASKTSRNCCRHSCMCFFCKSSMAILRFTSSGDPRNCCTRRLSGIAAFAIWRVRIAMVLRFYSTAKRIK